MSDIIEEVKRTPMQHRQRIYFVILGLVILASGFGLGASSTFFYLKDRIRPKPFIQPDGGPDRRPWPNPVEKWAARYGFTDEQKKQVKAALERQHQAFKETFEAGWKRMEAAKDMLVKDMNAILTTEQFNAWYEDFKERLKRRRRGPGPGSGGRGGPPHNRGDRPPHRDGYKNREKDGDPQAKAPPQ